MLIGARTGAWAASGGGKPTARDYVQDGLIAMWDGIENAGWGVHDPNAAVWKDLVGGAYGDLEKVGGEWLDDCISGSSTLARSSSKIMTDHVVECVFECANVHGSTASSVGNVVHFGYSRHGIGFLNDPNGFGRSLFYSYQRAVIVDTSRLSVHAYFPQTTNVREKAEPIFVNGELNGDYTTNDSFGFNTDAYIRIGGAMNSGAFSGKVHSVRFYNRALTADEIAANYAVDKARFGLAQRSFRNEHQR